MRRSRRTSSQLAVFRVFLGIGMGGEWASGAALVSETWPAEHRGKALGLMQSCWAIGYGAAAIVDALVLPRFGWRAVFFVGVLPGALHALDPAAGQGAGDVAAHRTGARCREHSGRHLSRRGIFCFTSRTVRGTRDARPFLTIALTLMNAATMFAWWGFNLWIPAYLSLPVAQGGIGLTTVGMSGFVVAMQVGMWFGYVTFGFVSDRFGRKPTYVTYLVAASVLRVRLRPDAHAARAACCSGPFVAFFGTGYFSGFGAITAEIYPTSIRATAQGFTYNIGRLASAQRPFVVGIAGAGARLRRRVHDDGRRVPAWRPLSGSSSRKPGGGNWPELVTSAVMRQLRLLVFTVAVCSWPVAGYVVAQTPAKKPGLPLSPSAQRRAKITLPPIPNPGFTPARPIDQARAVYQFAARAPRGPEVRAVLLRLRVGRPPAQRIVLRQASRRAGQRGRVGPARLSAEPGLHRRRA